MPTPTATPQRPPRVPDTLTPEERSKRMSLVRSKDTKPEMIVRRLVHGFGYRYRLHVKDLPGRPDMVFPSRRAVIFVHGCFWHQHPDPACKLARQPKSRMDFWRPKLLSNRVRDERNIESLTSLGWRVLSVWECEVRDQERLREKVVGFLGGR